VIPDLHLENPSPVSSITAFIKMKNKLHVHSYLSKELIPLMTTSWSSALVALVDTFEWKIYHGGLWKRDIEGFWEEEFVTGLGIMVRCLWWLRSRRKSGVGPRCCESWFAREKGSTRCGYDHN
jgi:hypothetical protein